MNPTNKKARREAFKAALLAGESVPQAAKLAGVDMRQARLWAGMADILEALQLAGRSWLRVAKPVSENDYQKGRPERNPNDESIRA